MEAGGVAQTGNEAHAAHPLMDGVEIEVVPRLRHHRSVGMAAGAREIQKTTMTTTAMIGTMHAERTGRTRP